MPIFGQGRQRKYTTVLRCQEKQRKIVINKNKHTLSNKVGLRLYGSPDEAFIVQPSDRHPDLAVARHFLELDRHIQMAVGAEGTGCLRRDIEEDVVSGRPHCGRGVLDSGADNNTRGKRVGPEGDSRALRVAGDVIYPLDIRCDMLLGGVQRPTINVELVII